MDAISFLMALLIYHAMFNLILVIPAAIVAGVLSLVLALFVSDDVATIIAIVPIGLAVLGSMWLSYRSAQNFAYYNYGFREAAMLAVTEAKVLVAVGVPFLRKK